jgi:hypothetical protein
VENSFEFFQVIFETALGQTEEIIDLGLHELQSVKQFRHLLLKDAGTVT